MSAHLLHIPKLGEKKQQKTMKNEKESPQILLKISKHEVLAIDIYKLILTFFSTL